MSNRSGTRYSAPTDANRRPVLLGVSTADGITPLPLEVDPITGGLLVDTEVTVGSVTVIGTNANLYTGQVTVNTSQVQVSSSSHALTNGIILKAPSTNAANIFVGLTGVTTSTGDMLEPGDARGYAVNNTNLLYIISATSNTDLITYSGN